MQTRSLIAGAMVLASCGGDAAAPLTQAAGEPARISAIQGSGPVSPLDGQAVLVFGVVTGDFQDQDSDDRRNLGGFYIQDESPDADSRTSDGVFVHDGNSPAVDVRPGDRVEVSGTVTEYFGETQVNAATVRVTGTGLVIPQPIDLPAAESTLNDDGRLIADLERFEGMLVEFSDPLTVTDLRNLGRFGEVRLSGDGRLYWFTNDNRPDAAGYDAHAAMNARRSVVLDDGLRTQNPVELHYLDAGDTPGYSIRLGDTVEGLTGNLRFSRGSGGAGRAEWRVMPTADPVFASANPRPSVPAVDGTIRVGGFNVLNLFTSIDDGSDRCGPRGKGPCRGADSSTELSRQIEKTVTAFIMSGADIFGLTELENNADASLSVLVDAMNARAGADTYAYVRTGMIHTDVIKPGIIYRRTAVSRVGDFALLDNGVDARFDDRRNRPVLAQTFVVDATGATFTVAVAHLKSKGSDCAADGDPDLGDGQGNCNLARVGAANALVDWLAGDPTGSGDDDFLLIGDMNAYFLEDPIEVFRNAGMSDLLERQADPYSFVFDSQSGALDHAFASPALAPQVTDAAEWHINADEPPVLDYNLEHGRNPGLFDAGTPYRASDHDPIIVGLELKP